MKKKSFFSVLAIVVAVVLMFTLSFNHSAQAAEEEVFEEEYEIRVVVHGGIADPFWLTFEQGVRDAADNHDDLSVTYSGPETYDLAEFISDVETGIAAEPDALVVTLTEPDAMDGMLRPVIEDGLPVIAVNAPDLRDDPIPVDTYVGEESYHIGEVAALESLERFDPEAAVFANHHPGAANIEARGDGFIETLEEHGVEAESVNIDVDPAEGAEIINAHLQANPEVDLIFSTNVLRTEAIIPRLEDEGIEVGEDVKIAQMDLAPAILNYIEDGKIMFTLDQQQYMQGYLGVEFAYLAAKFHMAPPPAPVSTGPGVVTAEDVELIRTLVDDNYR